MEIIGCGGICYQSELPSPENLSGINGYLMNIYTLPEMTDYIMLERQDSWGARG